jgi:hypothetical protein
VHFRPILLRREPPVELHDLKADPVQVHNLAYDPDYQYVWRRLRNRLHQHQLDVRDTGFLLETQIHARSAEGEALYMHDQRVRAVVERAARRDLSAVPALVADYRLWTQPYVTGRRRGY